MIVVSILFTLHLYIYTSHGKELYRLVHVSQLLSNLCTNCILIIITMYMCIKLLWLYRLTHLCSSSANKLHTQCPLWAALPLPPHHQGRDLLQWHYYILWSQCLQGFEAAVLSASAQVTDTVYTGLRGINVKPWVRSLPSLWHAHHPNVVGGASLQCSQDGGCTSDSPHLQGPFWWGVHLPSLSGVLVGLTILTMVLKGLIRLIQVASHTLRHTNNTALYCPLPLCVRSGMESKP